MGMVVEQSGDTNQTLVVTQRSDLRGVRKTVVKIGSALLVKGGAVAFERMAEQIEELLQADIQVTLVTSGAVALGRDAFRSQGVLEPVQRRAAAALGQRRLMEMWSAAFRPLKREIAQLLISESDLKSRRRYVALRSTISTLHHGQILPIVNENDSVAITENLVGDNDTLAAEVAGLIFAPVVILLTSTNGLYDVDPTTHKSANRLSVLYEIEGEALKQLGQEGQFGTGGPRTKLLAAARARVHGAATVIASGLDVKVLPRIFDGEDIGTLVVPPPSVSGGARKRWIATTPRAVGQVVVDSGARKALCKNGSLLFAGIKEIRGEFEAGEVVEVVELGHAAPFARGIGSVSSHLTAVAAGKRTSEVRKVVSQPVPDEFIHRDNLVLLESGTDSLKVVRSRSDGGK